MNGPAIAAAMLFKLVEAGRAEVTWAQMARALRRLHHRAPRYQADKLLDYLNLQGVLLGSGVARFTLHPRLREGLSLLSTGVLAPLDYLAYAASECRAWERDRGLPLGGTPMPTR
jgi:hypothetical protein